MNGLNIFQKRLELMIGARFREESSIKEAVKAQDLVRSKAGFWDGSKEIRIWRERKAN
jgi:hypothetical protein